MSNKSNIQKIKSLRDRLCSQQSEKDKNIKKKDCLLEALQIIHREMKESNDTPEWCIKRIESILSEELVPGEENV
jgi:RNA polymerase-interacting CarD/CdnL/TRCF family regulator|tara:strand:+ start:9 stop:233 length:225 start_codon:yes stop_codon:yes gene_type:complete